MRRCQKLATAQNVLLVATLVTMSLASNVIADVSSAYIIVDLDPNGQVSCAYSINNKGQIVGYSIINQGARAILFDPNGNGNNVNLGTLGGWLSYAYSINDKGQIVGEADASSYGSMHATLFDPNESGNNVDLDPLGISIAYSINNNDQIVGQSNSLAMLFDPNGTGDNINLDVYTDNSWSYAYSINNNGQIVGFIDSNAVIFDSNGSGNNLILGKGEAYSINDNGQIVGQLGNHAAIYDPTGSGNNIELGTLPDYYYRSMALSINNKGQIVGYAARYGEPEGDIRAVLFDPTGNGNNVDLNELIDTSIGWTLIVAHCINDNGWIVGEGETPEGYYHAFLLKPLPISAPVDIKPDTLNLSSSRKWITCYIWFTEDYDVADVDTGSIILEGDIAAAQVWIDEEDSAVMAKFSRSDVQDILEIGQVELTVTGEFNNSVKFEGSDVITVRDKGIRQRVKRNK